MLYEYVAITLSSPMWKMLLLLVLSLYSPTHAALRGRLQAEPAEGQSELGSIITNLLSDSEVLLESMVANTHEISLDDQLTPATPTTTAMTQESDDETTAEPTVNENEILDDGAPLSDDGYDEEPSRPSERKEEESPVSRTFSPNFMTEFFVSAQLYY